ncbi:MAG: bis(5'-nucleosyl)-tetraphosphatase (symmetrical) YqeK [Lachnospiraceae bacterium]|nr:bis(5'-nucleosyl)-tetraphosphatase (symmetrical) YqeK [Lachnospiraceae bacterium]
MRDNDLDSIKKKLSKKLKKDRYNHVVAVSYIAAALAMRYGYNIKKAEAAGLVHDCAKAYKTKKFIPMAEKFGIEYNEIERRNPQLLHAKLGAYFAKKDFEITDPEILDSIIYHTTGRPNMTLLDKIVFVADYIEPGRYKQKRLQEIREMAFNDLDESIRMILSDTLEHLQSKKYAINPITEETYNFYVGEKH